jgi:predicted AAA+ superfamily ATPase
LEDLLLQGGYPALYDRSIQARDWFANYVATYLERDVRQLVNVRDLGQFQTFLKMCAARTGQLLNLSSLGADCGISAVTARHWLSVLEASDVVTLLRPHHRNFGKRLVKTPKLYFLDCGLAAWLLGIQDAPTLQTHSARGALFESLVISELLKQRYNRGQPSDLHFWRDSSGHEVDVLIPMANQLQPVEVKSGRTFAADWAEGLQRWQRLAADEKHEPGVSKEAPEACIVYGGDHSQQRSGFKLIGWRDIPSL